MGEPFQVRDATEADIPAIAAIYAPEVENGISSLEDVAPSEAEMAQRMAKIKGQGLPYLIAARRGDVLGYCYAAPFHVRSGYRYTLEDTIYIHRDFRRQKVGHALLENLLERTEYLGCRQMIALICGPENGPSVSLHETFGFRPMGVARSVGFKFGAWRDVIYLQRAVGLADLAPPDRPALGLPA